MKLKLQWMESPSLPAMNVLSLFADLAMNMREERVIRHVLIAKPDTSATKVPLHLHLYWLHEIKCFPYIASKDIGILQAVQE